MEEMTLNARYLGRLEPAPYDVNGNKGTTYKIQIMLKTPKGDKPCSLKVSEEFYLQVVENQLSFGDELAIIFKPDVRLSVQNGRAVEDLKITPDSFNIVSAFGKVAAD